MAQKNFDIDDGLADAFKVFCKSRGLSMSYAAGASLMWFMHASAQEREDATLRYDKSTGNAGGRSMRLQAAKKAGPSRTRGVRRPDAEE